MHVEVLCRNLHRFLSNIISDKDFLDKSKRYDVPLTSVIPSHFLNPKSSRNLTSMWNISFNGLISGYR